MEDNSAEMGRNISYSDDGEKIEFEKVNFSAVTPSREGALFRQEVFGNIPVEVTVEMGKTKISLQDIMELNKGSIIELAKRSGEPLDVLVGGKVIAKGEVVAIDDHYGLRVTKVVDAQK